MSLSLLLGLVAKIGTQMRGLNCHVGAGLVARCPDVVLAEVPSALCFLKCVFDTRGPCGDSQVMDHNAVSGVNPPVMARKLVRLLTDSKDVKMSYVCNGSETPAPLMLNPPLSCAALSDDDVRRRRRCCQMAVPLLGSIFPCVYVHGGARLPKRCRL